MAAAAREASNMPKPVYILVGSDSFLQLRNLAQILAEFPVDVQRFDYDGDRAELVTVLDELRGFAMFGIAKVVIIRDADQFIDRFREPLEKYLASNETPAGSLVLRMNSMDSRLKVSKLLAKVGQVIKCISPKTYELPAWISEQARSGHRIKIAFDAAKRLAELIGEDLGRLDNELGKLALSAQGGIITIHDVELSVAFQCEQEMWHMTGEIGSGRVAAALSRWRLLTTLDRSAEFRAVTWLGIWLEKVRKALQMEHEGQSQATISRDLRIYPPNEVPLFMRTAHKLGQRGVAQAIDMLVALDRNIKSGLGDGVNNVERFLIEAGLMLK